MRVVLSLTSANEGEVRFFGDKSIRDVGLKVGSLIESPVFYNIASNFEKKPTFNNLLVSVLYYVIYTGVFLFVGIQLTKNKEI